MWLLDETDHWAEILNDASSCRDTDPVPASVPLSLCPSTSASFKVKTCSCYTVADQILVGKQMPCVGEVEFVCTESTLGHRESVNGAEWHTERQYGDGGQQGGELRRRRGEGREWGWRRMRGKGKVQTEEINNDAQICVWLFLSIWGGRMRRRRARGD